VQLSNCSLLTIASIEASETSTSDRAPTPRMASAPPPAPAPAEPFTVTGPPVPPPTASPIAANANAWWLLGPGVSFPADAEGVRSTTRPAKSVWAAAALGLGTEEGAALAAELLDEKDWRHAYPKYAVRLAELQSTARAEKCVASCEAGLDAAASTFEWRRGETSCVLKRAMADPAFDAPIGEGLRTAIVRGTPSRFSEHPSPEGEPAFPGGEPVDPDFETVAGALCGDAVAIRATEWARRGCAEPDVPEALARLRANRRTYLKEDLKETLFVLLGGTSELCPLAPLLALGASVAVVARRSAKLLEAVSSAAASRSDCALYLPLAPASSESDGRAPVEFFDGEILDDATASAAGANLATQTPEIRTWIRNLFSGGPAGGPGGPGGRSARGFSRLVVGAYAYADGEAHVRTSLASDVILSDLCSEFGPEKVCAAFLSSPGTATAIPEAAWLDAEERFRRREDDDGVFHWRRLVGFALNLHGGGFKRNCRPAVTRVLEASGDLSSRRPVYAHDGHVILQGPNYALAKTMQNWRATVAGAAGFCVSANMAPGSRTRSMRRVKTVALALEGQKHFPPLRAFDVDETRWTMAALLLRDLGADQDDRRGRASDESGGSGLKKENAHPTDIFGERAVHGGTWRCPWSVDSVGRASVVAGTLWG